MTIVKLLVIPRPFLDGALVLGLVRGSGTPSRRWVLATVTDGVLLGSGENSSLRLTDTHSIVARLFSTADCDILSLSRVSLWWCWFVLLFHRVS